MHFADKVDAIVLRPSDEQSCSIISELKILAALPLLISSGPLLTSTLHPNNWRSSGRGFSMVCLSLCMCACVCVCFVRGHTHKHTDTHLHPAACHCYFALAASLRKEAPGDCVCFSKGVFDVCVCM